MSLLNHWYTETHEVFRKRGKNMLDVIIDISRIPMCVWGSTSYLTKFFLQLFNNFPLVQTKFLSKISLNFIIRYFKNLQNQLINVIIKYLFLL